MASPLPNPNNPNNILFHPPNNPNNNIPFIPNPGARLMALLNQPPPMEQTVSMPTNPYAPPVLQTLPSAKIPRGRVLGTGDRAVYDIGSRLPGESLPPQLEVTPITKYVSDPGLVLGRQIAVNRTYICYGLKLGTIRVLNSITALRALLKGHTQRVTDMAFFADDVHLLASVSVDGRVFVWKIDEGPDDENKPQITGKVVIAMHIVGDAESYHPRICWHSHKQEIVFVGIGNRVLRIDTIRVGRGKEFSAEEPLKCPLDKLIDGVQLIGKHDGEVTDLSISQWMLTRIASASKDGTVTIWDDRRVAPLVTLRPHNGEPVDTVEFLTSPHQPDHINLITAGPLNREIKIWASASEEGWLLPSDSESWQCTQILDLRSSLEPRFEEAFFNQIVVLPQASLIVIANAKKNAIYAVHVDYGQNPASTRMDYIADFAVTMPILSLIGTTEIVPDGEQVVQVYCVQTQAIQQYALDLTQCLPAPTASAGPGRVNSSCVLETSNSDVSVVAEPIRGPGFSDIHLTSVSPQAQLGGVRVESAPAVSYPATPVSADMAAHILPTTKIEVHPSALPSTDSDAPALSPPSIPVSIAGNLSTQGSSQQTAEEGSSFGTRDIEQSGFEYSTESRIVTNAPEISTNDSTRKDDSRTGQHDTSAVPNPRLITPSEILSGVLSSESNYVKQGLVGDELNSANSISETKENVDLGVKVASESRPNQQESDSSKSTNFLNEDEVRFPKSSEANFEVGNGHTTTSDCSNVKETSLGSYTVATELIKQSSSAAEERYQDITRDIPEKIMESALTEASAFEGKKQKPKQTSGPSSPSSSPFNSTDFFNIPASSFTAPPTEAASPQILAIHDELNQAINMQKDLQKQMAVMLAGPVTKEGKRLETALGRSMEKTVRANVDTLWVHIQEENAKKEKVEIERWQQITSLITNSMNKELPAILERTLKKEISAIGPAVARSISPIISSAIAESFQRGVGDKAVNQLEKSVSSKIETTIAKQIQTVFQTSGKQTLQDVLKSSLESSVIPAFDRSCKTMFEQIDNAFQKGIAEHTVATQLQLEAAHTPLALALRDAIHSASSITQNLSNELLDGQHKLLALVAAGNTKALNPVVQQTNGPVAGLPEIKVETPLDPTKELSRMISEHKYEEAFTMALQRSDVSIVSWLCAQVDLRAICNTLPLPLSQGVLLALLQQLACDINNDTSKKVGWMTDVAVAINPADPMIALHVRPIFEQVYSILGHQRSLPTTKPSEAANIRLTMHVINSVLMSCK